MIAIPRTSLEVFPICLGTCDIGSMIDEQTSMQLLDSYVEGGGNFLDSAAVYANWLPIEPSISEKTIGKWMKARGNRDNLIVATKGAHPNLTTMHIPRVSRREIESDLHDSLRHLKTDRIDLYWLHRDDANRPAAEILEVLNDCVGAGKIRYFGCSNWTLSRLEAAQQYADEHSMAGFAGNQMLWNIAAVKPDAIADSTMVVMDEAMWQYHQTTGLAAIPYSSQAQGLFHKMVRGVQPRGVGGDARYDTRENFDRCQRIQRLSDDTSLTITQIVLGYLLSQPFATVPIVGPRTITQLHDVMTGGHVQLTSEQIAFLEGRG